VDLGRSIKGRGHEGKNKRSEGSEESSSDNRQEDEMQVEVKTIKTIIGGKAAFRRHRMILKKPGVDKV
jgi:hypothetical protein